jgi:hypothetical protein
MILVIEKSMVLLGGMRAMMCWIMMLRVAGRVESAGVQSGRVDKKWAEGGTKGALVVLQHVG